MITQSELIQADFLLKPFRKTIEKRRQNAILKELLLTDGKCTLSEVANNYLYYGLHKTKGGWVFREKAPLAKEIYIYGDFSYWEIRSTNALHSIGNGDWEIVLPLSFLKHGSLFKLWVVWQDGADERLPSYARSVVQDDKTKIFCAQVWDPDNAYTFRYTSPVKPAHPIIYECHIGMSSEEATISSYRAFEENVLPRIRQLGYNAIQIMAIQEHPYYGSFGYQVSNFFAPSSRFGTPDELAHLIDTAHQSGLFVILDIVHSHAVSNAKEGIGQIDGSDHLYCHSGDKGKHPVWDSRCFDYGKPETLLFLLSNIKYWMEVFHFDGFRFDGVTSMCYWNHGIGVDFVDYKQYFDDNVDEEAVSYLTIANKMIREINRNAITIAEDVSGMPGMAFPVEKGGVGFDFRMSMGIADYWTKIIKELPDEQWNVGELFFKMTDKRKEEKTVNYAESHDQSLVGDKTIIFRLIDKEMYTDMSIYKPNLKVDRGIALHKMIRLLTLSLADGGYLNFMGNEFGHPEWIDFPREGNNRSYQYARRQWSLADNKELKYYALNLFDKAMIDFISKKSILDFPATAIIQNIADQVLVFQRGDHLFIFNFSPCHSYPNYEIPCREDKYTVSLNTDDPLFSGFGILDNTLTYPAYQRLTNRYVKIYIPARSAFILSPSSNRIAKSL